MIKYATILFSLASMGAVISIIDAKSSDGAAGSHRTADTRPDGQGRIYASGRVEGASQDIELRLELSGRIRDVAVKEGQWVNAGNVLVRLDSERQQKEVALAAARLELARAELQRLQNGAQAEEREEAAALADAAKTRVEQAVRNLEIFQKLRSTKAITQQEADDQQSLVDTSRSEWAAARARVKRLNAPARADELRAAEARVSAAAAEVELAKIGLSKTELRAPCHGRVLAVHGEPGELTGQDSRQPIVILSDTSTIRVRAYVEELDAPRVTLNAPAQITADGLPGVSYTGHVVSISPCMEKKSLTDDRPNEIYDTKTREVLVELQNSPDLIIGLRVDVVFAADEETHK
jgi:multidrug resistance efflux pump